MSEERCEELLGKHVASWVLKNSREQLTMARAALWGLTESTTYETAEDGTPNFCDFSDVHRVVLGNPMTGEEDGVYRKTVTEEGDEAWDVFLFYTLFERGIEGLDEEDEDIQDGDCPVVDRGNKEVLVFNEVSPNIALMRLDRFCVNNPLTPVIFNVPGNRKFSKKAEKYHDKSTNVWCLAKRNGCMIASFINALFLLGGEERAREALRAKKRWIYSNFKDLARWKSVGAKDISLQREEPEDGFGHSWITSLETGIYLVSLEGTKGVKHVVTIHTGLNLIFDSMERYAMHLSWDALKACLGNDDIFTNIVEVRKVRWRRQKV